MKSIKIPLNEKRKILSLGAESMGRFCFYNNGEFFISADFGDILNYDNFKIYDKAILRYIRSCKPDLILTDLHPLYNSTILGEELSKKLKIPHIKVQHHIAHIFSSIGDRLSQDASYSVPDTFFGIAMDGTGYGFDGNIWGGEVFQIENEKYQIKNANARYHKQPLNIKRIGSLEEQTMIGGDLAVEEPARMVIAILDNIKKRGTEKKNTDENYDVIKTKNDIYGYVSKYYSRKEFDLLYSQLQQDFNCQKTTSAGRILDAVSVLLGFAGNERNFKHEATRLLQENSSIPYNDCELRFTNYELRIMLDTTHLFEYLTKNIHKDKKRLAATAQLYIAKGLYGIAKNVIDNKHLPLNICSAGGMANNKIISGYLMKKDVYISKKIPCGDEGVAFGQLSYLLCNKTKKPYPVLAE